MIDLYDKLSVKNNPYPVKSAKLYKLANDLYHDSLPEIIIAKINFGNIEQILFNLSVSHYILDIGNEWKFTPYESKINKSYIQTEKEKESISIEEIIDLFELVVKNHKLKTPDAVVYINKLAKTINQYILTNQHNPLSNFFSAFYDAIMFEQNWINISKKQFLRVLKIIKKIIIQPDIKIIKGAIIELERIGFDTTPF
jgi:hypothetical protein